LNLRPSSRRSFKSGFRAGGRQVMLDKVTNTIAAGAVTSPWWMPSLADISTNAALLLPILGCAWLIVQIITKLIDRN
ncbi:hypothetical protein LB579_33650, partial [Mesorhizobium sp. BR1-1-7]|uniref:hypothetical protein n=1 Tax=Mesorhizobium sp. BR1-1-7 TaxID=2876647 RepID=UPI001CC94CC6